MFKDFKFKSIDCMISENKQTLGFFKNDNDVRPSQATYIKKEDAEHLYDVFNKEKGKVCPKCRKRRQFKHKFCYECGVKLVLEKTFLNEKTKFCHYCFNRLTNYEIKVNGEICFSCWNDG